MRLVQLRISQLRTDGGTQLRAMLDQEALDQYAEALAAGCVFPPVVAFWDGRAYWLADGFHRLRAHDLARRKCIDVDVRPGALRDAILYAAGANVQHGLRRSNDDKRRAVLTLLHDAEWGRWSNSEIARRCGVSEFLIRTLRLELASIKSSAGQDGLPGMTAPDPVMPAAETGNPVSPSAPTASLPPQEGGPIECPKCGHKWAG